MTEVDNYDKIGSAAGQQQSQHQQQQQSSKTEREQPMYGAHHCSSNWYHHMKPPKRQVPCCIRVGNEGMRLSEMWACFIGTQLHERPHLHREPSTLLTHNSILSKDVSCISPLRELVWVAGRNGMRTRALSICERKISSGFMGSSQKSPTSGSVFKTRALSTGTPPNKAELSKSTEFSTGDLMDQLETSHCRGSTNRLHPHTIEFRKLSGSCPLNFKLDSPNIIRAKKLKPCLLSTFDNLISVKFHQSFCLAYSYWIRIISCLF